MTRASTASDSEAGEGGITIRRLATHEDLVACHALQREVWGQDFQECVAPALLKVSQRVGGIVAGAFDERGELLGFVFGMTGVAGGRRVHWSHMLGVCPGARGTGIGRRLKEYQRRAAAEQGVDVISWSFDPLVSRNAHLNLNRLGARVAEYVPDMYPPTASKLHGSIPLDRLVVSWPTREAAAGDGVGGAVGGAVGGEGAGGEGAVRGTGDAVVALDWRSSNGRGAAELLSKAGVARSVRIRIPREYDQLVQSSPSAALEIRMRTRDFFVTCLARGYRITGFERDTGGDPCYLLSGPGH